MNYRNFTEQIKKEIVKRLGDDFSVHLHQETKNNGEKRTGLLIGTQETNIFPIIYLEEYYEAYKNGKKIEEIVEELQQLFFTIRKRESWNSRKLLNYKNVKDQIGIRLINTDRNQEILKKLPHIKFWDLSAVFYVLLGVSEEGTASMVIANQHMNQWGIKVNTLWEDALKNSSQYLRPEFSTMSYALKNAISYPANPQGKYTENIFESCELEKDRHGMYVLSNQIRNYGASCIIYPSIAERIGRILETDYYIIPSSVHELIIIPAEGSEICPDEINEMIQNVNRDMVSREEVLSEHCYKYLRGDNKIIIP